MSGREKLDWDRDGQDWPNRESSRFVEARGLRWHVQVMGQGPVLLLIHGTGASTHSWRTLAPRLATRFTVVAPDLPGHGFTDLPAGEGMSLPGMAAGVHALLTTMGMAPAFAAGHSAGAAILARMCLDGAIAPAGLISLNGALLPIGGAVGQLFSPLARLFASSSIVPRFFARQAGDKKVVERLIRQTGSTLDTQGTAFYETLARNSGHVTGALRMMANWDLKTLQRDLPRLKTPLVLVVGGSDRTIAPDDGFRVRAQVPGATVDYLRGLGHLAHEERPAQIAELIERHADAWTLAAA